MKNPRRLLSLAFGLLVIVFATSKPWRSETASLVYLATTNPILEVDSNPEVAAPSVRQVESSPVTPKQRQPQQTAQQKAVQALPQTEQESLWSTFASARRAVQPLTDHEASLPHNKGVCYFAQNPGQQLTARFLDGTVRIESGRGSKWAATLGLAGAAKTKPIVTQERVEYRHSNGITEWYENRAEGIEHAFTVSQRPDEASPELRLALALQGVEARLGKGEQTGTITLADPTTGAPVLSYGTLKVWDATGRELAARYETREQGMDIVVADAGAVYPVTIDPLIGSLEAKLGPEVTGNGVAGDRFGRTVALSGDTAIVGVEQDSTAAAYRTGSVYVFTRSGAIWTQQIRLIANDAGYDNYFGSSVALLGNTALIGAYMLGDTAGGCAYIFIRNGTTWTQQAKLTGDKERGLFGGSVSLSDNTVLVGACGEDSRTGSAYVFARSGTTWTRQAKLTASDGMQYDNFGGSVSISGHTALVGAFGDDSYKGSAYVFIRNGTTWTQQAKLTASNRIADTYFGGAVAISGDTALVGGVGEYAHIFVRNGIAWSLQAQIASSDSGVGGFGGSVALSGNTALATGDGTVYVFIRNGTGWAKQATLNPSGGGMGGSMGGYLALSNDTVLVGAAWASTEAGGEAGSAYVFTSNGTVWSQQAKLTHGDAADGSVFGSSLAMSDETALIGSPRDNTAAGNKAGSVYVLTRNGTIWTHQAILKAADAESGNEFGNAVAISGETVLVGSSLDELTVGWLRQGA